jgi:hypothetical protein
MDNTKSAIPRCVHHVFFADHHTTDKNLACSLCVPINVPPDAKHIIVKDEDGHWSDLKS